MLHDHGAEKGDNPLASEQQAGVGGGLRGRISPGQRPKGPAHAEVHMQHHCVIALAKEVEQVLAVALYAVQRLLIDSLGACKQQTT